MLSGAVKRDRIYPSDLRVFFFWVRAKRSKLSTPSVP